MRFINPEYLYFLIFALVPIILYFFNLQKTIKVEFSNVDMLEDVKRKTSNRFQLKRLLIMVSRILFVVFAVLAFAQPTLKDKKDSSSEHHILFIDNSLSMTRSVETKILLDHAKATLENILPNSKGHKFSFLTNDDQRLSLDYLSKKDLLKEVSSIKSSTYNTGYQQIRNSFRRKKSDLPKHYYFLSDFQKSRFTSIDDSVVLSKNEKMSFVNLQADQNNIFIDSVWVDSKYIVAGNQVEVNFRTINKGESPKDVLVKCLVDNRQVSSKVVKLSKGDAVIDQITIQVPKQGYNNCVLEVEDQNVSFDNDYKFVLEANKNINVLIIKSDGISYFESAYKNELLFLVKTFVENEFNSSALDGIDLLVLESVNQLVNLPKEQIKEFVYNGGCVTVVPDENISAVDLQQFMKNIGSNTRISKTEGSKEQLDFNQIKKDDFYRGVFESTDQKIQGAWFVPKFNVSGGTSILNSRKGNSFLKSLNLGRGQLFIFNSPFVMSETDVFRHSLFVPTSYQLAMNSFGGNKNLSFSISKEALIIKSINPSAGSNYALVSSSNQYIEEQQVQGKDLIIYLTDNEASDFYDVRTKEETLTRIALNYDRKESDFEPMNLSSLNINDNIEVMNLDVLENEAFSTESGSIQLWKWLIVLALLSLLFETSLIKFLK